MKRTSMILNLPSAGAIALAAVALALLVASPGSATAPKSPGAPSLFPTAPDFEIYDPHPPSLDEGHPDVAYNPQEDEYLVVFDRESSTGDLDVYGIVVEAGAPASSLIPIGVHPDFDDSHPAVAYNPDARSYLVVWQRSHHAESYRAIAGSMVTTAAGAPFTIHGTLHGDQRRPDVAYASVPERFLVVWESHEPFTDPPDILGTAVDSAGADISPAITVSLEGTTTGEQTTPAVAACAPTGRWLVAWTDNRRSGPSGADIYAQQVKYAEGAVSLWSGVLPVGAVASWAGAPAVAWGPVGEGDSQFLVAWTDNADTTYARRVEADNTLFELLQVSDTQNSKAAAAVTFAAGSHDWWVVWDSG